MQVALSIRQYIPFQTFTYEACFVHFGLKVALFGDVFWEICKFQFHIFKTFHRGVEVEVFDVLMSNVINSVPFVEIKLFNSIFW